MIKYKIRDVAFECDEEKGTSKIITAEGIAEYGNAVEGWNIFAMTALLPFEKHLRDELEKNGFNRWTGDKNYYTESELKEFDVSVDNARRHHEL